MKIPIKYATHPPSQKLYEDGWVAFNDNKNVKTYNYSEACPFQDAGWQRSAWCGGFCDARDTYSEKLAQDFKEELNALCLRYKVSMKSGCGCCGYSVILDGETGYEFDYNVGEQS